MGGDISWGKASLEEEFALGKKKKTTFKHIFTLLNRNTEENIKY